MSQPMLRDFWQTRRRTAGLTERNALDPICTSLLRKQYIEAIQACQKVLRNKPYWPIVQTLLALAHWHTHDWKTALLIADEVSSDTKGKGKSPQDEDIITLLSWLYARLKKRAKAIKLWETATIAKRDDLNLALLATNFFTAESMYGAHMHAHEQVMDIIPKFLESGVLNDVKLKEDGRNDLVELQSRSFWHSALAVIMQHETGMAGAQENVARYADLLRRHINNSNEPEYVQSPLHNIRTYHQYTLFVRLYQLHLDHLKQTQSRDYTGIRNQVVRALYSGTCSEMCDGIISMELLRREIVLQHGSTQHLDALWRRLATALEAKKDYNWSTIDTLISSALIPQIITQVNGGTSSQLDTAQDSQNRVRYYTLLTKTLLQKLAGDDIYGLSKEERGYTLGLLKLASKTDPSSLGKHIKLYFTRHCDKAACFDDLVPYLQQLVKSAESTSDVLVFLSARKYEPGQSLNDVETITKTANAEKIHRAILSPPSLDDEIRSAKLMAQAYFETSHLAVNLTETDLHPGDDFALLSAEAWVAAYTISNSIAHLESAIAILTVALKSSKYRYQLRVLLIRTLRMMGAAQLVLQHHELLNPKQTQIDSISHFAFERGSALVLSAMPSPAKTGIKEVEQPRMLHELQRMVSWYERAEDEANHSIVGAWNSEVYAILENQEAFQSHLRRSLVRQSLLQEAVRVHIMTGEQGNKQRTQLFTAFTLALRQLNSLHHDNRDYSVLPDLQPIQTSTIHAQTQISDAISIHLLRCMGGVYEAFIDIDSGKPLSPILVPDDATSSEKQLLEWAQKTLAWLNTPEAGATDEEVGSIFKSLQQDIARRAANDLPWTTLHIAQVALEAYALFDMAYTSIAAGTTPQKKIKKIRQVRQDAKAALKSISTRLKALVEELSKQYKGKQKHVNLAWLQDFEQVAESQLMDIATHLLEARKSALSSMAICITQRIAGA